MTVDLNDYAPVRSALVDDTHVIANGIDQPRVWNGRAGSVGESWRLGELAPENAPTLTQPSSGSLTGTFTYRITYVREASNGLPEYESGPSPSDEITVSSKKVTIAQGTPPSGVGWTHWRIYRSVNQGSTLLLVGDDNPIATSSVEDELSDEELAQSSQIETASRLYVNGLPPIFRDVVYIKGRLVGIQGMSASIGEVYPRHEHFQPALSISFPEKPLWLVDFYEECLVFCRHSVHRIVGLNDPLPHPVVVHPRIGSIMRPVVQDNALFFADPGRGPYLMDAGAGLDPIGAEIRDTWKEMHLGMLEFLPISIDPEERTADFMVATGTRPYSDLTLRYEWTTRQWHRLRPQGLGYAAGVLPNTAGREKVLVGTIAGNVLQHGEATDNAYGCFDGTQSGNPSNVGGNRLAIAGASFSEDIVGATVLAATASGDVTYRGTVIKRIDADELDVWPAMTSGVSVSDDVYIGGQEAYWTSKLDDLDNPGRVSMIRSLQVLYREGAATIHVAHQTDEEAWTDDDDVEADGDGADDVYIQDRGQYARFRVWDYTPNERFRVIGLIAEGNQGALTR